jgi:hypothetical protein
MKVCDHCKNKKDCAELPGICLKIPYVLATCVAVMVVVLLFNSTL